MGFLCLFKLVHGPNKSYWKTILNGIGLTVSHFIDWFPCPRCVGQSCWAFFFFFFGCSKYLISNYSTIPGQPWDFTRQSSINQLKFWSRYCCVYLAPVIVKYFYWSLCKWWSLAFPLIPSCYFFGTLLIITSCVFSPIQPPASGCHTKSPTQKQTLHIHILEVLQRICH